MIKVANQFFWNILDQLSGTLRSIIISIVAARILTVDELGVLMVAVSLRAIFQSFCTLGLDRSFVFLYETKTKESLKLSTFQLKTFLSIISVVAVYIYLFYINSETRPTSETIYIAIVFASILLTPLDVLDYINKSKKENQINAKARIYMLAFVIISRAVIFLLQSEIFYHVILIPLDYLIFYSFLLFKTKLKEKTTVKNYTKVNFIRIKKLAFFTIPLGVSSLMFIVKTRLDLLLVSLFLGNYYAGIYSVFTNFYQATGIGFVAISTVALPYFRSNKNNIGLYAPLSSFYFVYSVVVSLFILLLGEELIEIIFGNKYSKAYELLKLSIFSIVLWGFQSIRTIYLITIEKTHLILNIQFFTLLISVSALFFLIDDYGMIGGVYALIIGEFFGAILLNFFWKETRDCLNIQFKSLNLVKSLSTIKKLKSSSNNI